MKRACDTCEWLQPPERCAESNPWQTLPPARWCGRWRIAERVITDPNLRAMHRMGFPIDPEDVP